MSASTVTPKVDATPGPQEPTDYPSVEPEPEPFVAPSLPERPPTDREPAVATPSLAQPTASVTTSQATGPTLSNLIGTLAWNVLDTITKIVDVPPTMPPASPVSFGRSTLLIDCGPGYTADADWYYPSSGAPDTFIYFQHGFLARARFYDVTLRELAERNNAIVVAPRGAATSCRLARRPPATPARSPRSSS